MRDKLAGLTLRTTLLYAIFAAVCIVLSGRVVAALVSDVNTVAKLDIFKGLAFVAVIALLLYATLRRQMKWLEKEVDSRAQAELLIRESQARFVTIFRSGPVGITLSRLDDGRLVDANPAVLKMLGYNHEELVGRTLEEARVWVSPDTVTGSWRPCATRPRWRVSSSSSEEDRVRYVPCWTLQR